MAMTFFTYRRMIKLTKLRVAVVSPADLFCQYNPDLCEKWLRVATDYSILGSPHYRFLHGDEDPYRQMYRLYGRRRNWIENKARKFRDMAVAFDNGVELGMIEVLEVPLVPGPFNQMGMEIWEGHHRMAIHAWANRPATVGVYRWRV